MGPRYCGVANEKHIYKKHLFVSNAKDLKFPGFYLNRLCVAMIEMINRYMLQRNHSVFNF